MIVRIVMVKWDFRHTGIFDLRGGTLTQLVSLFPRGRLLQVSMKTENWAVLSPTQPLLFLDCPIERAARMVLHTRTCGVINSLFKTVACATFAFMEPNIVRQP
jgi:hypothetical protein